MVDSLTSTIRCGIFRKIETKRRCCADYIGSDTNWVTVFITWSLLLCLLLQIIWYVLSVFDLNHSNVHLWGMYPVKHTQLLANHSSGRLLLSLQSSTPIQTVFQNLGVIFDRSVCLNSHVKSVVRSCFFHLRNIAKIRSMVSKKEMKMLVHAFISTRLDYCNVLYTCLNKSSMDRLQLYRTRLQGFWLGPKGGHTLPLCLRPFIGFPLVLECIFKFWSLLIEPCMVRHPLIFMIYYMHTLLASLWGLLTYTF